MDLTSFNIPYKTGVSMFRYTTLGCIIILLIGGFFHTFSIALFGSYTKYQILLFLCILFALAPLSFFLGMYSKKLQKKWIKSRINKIKKEEVILRVALGTYISMIDEGESTSLQMVTEKRVEQEEEIATLIDELTQKSPFLPENEDSILLLKKAKTVVGELHDSLEESIKKRQEKTKGIFCYPLVQKMDEYTQEKKQLNHILQQKYAV